MAKKLDYTITGNAKIDAVNKARAENVAAGRRANSGQGDRSLARTPSAPDPSAAARLDLPAIGSANLKPSAALAPAVPPPATQAAGLLGTIDQQAKAYGQSVAPGAGDAKLAYDQSRKDFTDAVATQKTRTRLEDSYYQENVDPARQKLDAINNKIIAEQTASRRRVEAIEKNLRGATAEGLAHEVRQEERQSASYQADLSVQQLALQNDYYGAKEVADRKVSALLEEETNRLKALELTYQDNKDLFTRQEQRQFEAEQNERTRLLANEREDLTRVQDMAIDALRNGAPTSVVSAMQKATTAEEATRIGGQYIGKLDRDLKNAQLASEYQKIAAAKAAAEAEAGGYASLSFEDNARLNATPQAKAVNDGARFAQALRDYRAQIVEHGSGEWFGKGSGQLNSAYQTVVGAAKDYYQLGTLDNGVEKLIGLGIPKPAVTGIDSARIAAIDQQIKGVAENVDRNAQQLGVTRYANSIEGKTLIGTARELADEVRFRELDDDAFLSSIPYGQGFTLDNGAFFNAYGN